MPTNENTNDEVSTSSHQLRQYSNPTFLLATSLFVIFTVLPLLVFWIPWSIDSKPHEILLTQIIACGCSGFFFYLLLKPFLNRNRIIEITSLGISEKQDKELLHFIPWVSLIFQKSSNGRTGFSAIDTTNQTEIYLSKYYEQYDQMLELIQNTSLIHRK